MSTLSMPNTREKKPGALVVASAVTVSAPVLSDETVRFTAPGQSFRCR